MSDFSYRAAMFGQKTCAEAEKLRIKYDKMTQVNVADMYPRSLMQAYQSLLIKDVIFNGPATIVLWEDGTKTVVKKQPNETFDPEKAIAMAISKKALGNSGSYYNRIKQWLPEIPKSAFEIWAEQEVRLAIKYCADVNHYITNDEEVMFNMIKSLDACFNAIGSPIAVQAFINYLIEGFPLTPIEDTEDVWGLMPLLPGDNSNVISYQCNRRCSLFKFEYPDGTIKYQDLKACKLFDLDTKMPINIGLGPFSTIMDEFFPITMPYIPSYHPISIYYTSFNTKTSKNCGFIHAILPDGSRVDIKRFFEFVDGDWVKITKKEFVNRQQDLAFEE